MQVIKAEGTRAPPLDTSDRKIHIIAIDTQWSGDHPQSRSIQRTRSKHLQAQGRKEGRKSTHSCGKRRREPCLWLCSSAGGASVWWLVFFSADWRKEGEGTLWKNPSYGSSSRACLALLGSPIFEALAQLGPPFSTWSRSLLIFFLILSLLQWCQFSHKIFNLINLVLKLLMNVL